MKLGANLIQNFSRLSKDDLYLVFSFCLTFSAARVLLSFPYFFHLSLCTITQPISIKMVKEKHLVIGFLSTIIVFSLVFLLVKVTKSEDAYVEDSPDSNESDKSNSVSDENTSNSSSDEDDKKKKAPLPKCQPGKETDEDTSEEKDDEKAKPKEPEPEDKSEPDSKADDADGDGNFNNTEEQQ